MRPAHLLLAAIAAASFASAAQAGADRLGLSLGPGLSVEDVSGPAALAGIHRGDVLIGVDGIPLAGEETLRPYENVTGTVALLVRRGEDTFYALVVLEDQP